MLHEGVGWVWEMRARRTLPDVMGLGCWVRSNLQSAECIKDCSMALPRTYSPAHASQHTPTGTMRLTRRPSMWIFSTSSTTD